MSNPMSYNQLPHPTDRAHRVREIIGWTLRNPDSTVFDTFKIGTAHEAYTFGIWDETGHVGSQLASSAQLWHESGDTATQGRLFVATGSIATQALLPKQADKFKLRQQPRQLRLTLDNYQDAIVSANDLRIPGANRLQLVS